MCERINSLHFTFLRNLFLVLCALVPLHTLAQQGEYDVKAALLGKMLPYVEWSTLDSISNNPQKLKLAVIGKNPFGNALETLPVSENISISANPMTVRYINDIQEIAGSHIIFISSSETHRLSDILDFIADLPILSVGDTEGFASQGVHINFYIKDNKTRFELNESAAHAAGINIDFRLRKIAKIITSRKVDK